MPELTEADILALERRNYRRRVVSISLAGICYPLVGFALGRAWIDPTSPIRLTGLQALIVGAIALVLIYGANFAFMRRFRTPEAATSVRMRLLRADTVQRRATYVLLGMGGSLIVGMAGALLGPVAPPDSTWAPTLVFCGILGVLVWNLTTGLGLAALKPFNDEVTREHRRRALSRSYPAIMTAFVAAYLVSAADPSRVYWAFPLALGFSALLPTGLFAFWEWRAAGGD